MPDAPRSDDHDHGHEHGHGDDHGHGHIKIEIDEEPFRLDVHELTAEQLRALPDPDIGADRDLYLEAKHGDDELIEAGKLVHLKDEMRFFTAPATINPGR